MQNDPIILPKPVAVVLDTVLLRWRGAQMLKRLRIESGQHFVPLRRIVDQQPGDCTLNNLAAKPVHAFALQLPAALLWLSVVHTNNGRRLRSWREPPSPVLAGCNMRVQIVWCIFFCQRFGGGLSLFLSLLALPATAKVCNVRGRHPAGRFEGRQHADGSADERQPTDSVRPPLRGTSIP